MNRVEAALKEMPMEWAHDESDKTPLGKISIAAGRRKRRFRGSTAVKIEGALDECAASACAKEPEWVRKWIRGMRSGVLERLGQCHDRESRGPLEAKRFKLLALHARSAELMRSAGDARCRIRVAAQKARQLRSAAKEQLEEASATKLFEATSTAGGAAEGISAEECAAHATAMDDAATNIKRTGETLPSRATELRELIEVVEDTYKRRKLARGGGGGTDSSTPGKEREPGDSASSHVLAPVARLAQHLSYEESLVDFIDGS